MSPMMFIRFLNFYELKLEGLLEELHCLMRPTSNLESSDAGCNISDGFLRHIFLMASYKNWKIFFGNLLSLTYKLSITYHSFKDFSRSFFRH